MRALRGRFGDSARSFGQVFRNPNIRRIEGAWAASIMAHWAYGIALAVFAYRDGGAAAVGLVGLVRFLPSAVASPFTLGARRSIPPRARDRRRRAVSGRPPRDHDRGRRPGGAARLSSTSLQGSWPSRTPPCARRRPRSFRPLQGRRRSSPPPTSPRAPSRALASSGVPRSEACCSRRPARRSSSAPRRQHSFSPPFSSAACVSSAARAAREARGGVQGVHGRLRDAVPRAGLRVLVACSPRRRSLQACSTCCSS